MQINIISDTICPWCYIGERKFSQALKTITKERPDISFEINWRAFQLSPDTPKEGVDRKKSLKRKFGDGDHARAIYENIRQAGADAGLQFNFEAQERTPNTLDSHRLIRWSNFDGCQAEVVEALFKAYFMEGRDIGKAEVLIEIARDNGMDGDLVGELLASDADEEVIRAEDRASREQGIGGVPAFVFDNMFTIGGAQETETFERILRKIITRMDEVSVKA